MTPDEYLDKMDEILTQIEDAVEKYHQILTESSPLIDDVSCPIAMIAAGTNRLREILRQ